MTSNIIKFLTIRGLAVAAACLLAPLSHAQQVYRIVGPDGKVTFSDRLSPAANNEKTMSGAGGSSGSTSGSLPFELRQVASKYPVTLYTAENCGPCLSARAMLTMRGVPFAEKTVTTADDSQALQRISGEISLPFATIGSQQLKGFSESEWTQFLNAAGYPTVSVLPASYRQVAATPLVAVVTVPATTPNNSARNSEPARPAAPATPVAHPANNPAGIRF